MVKTSSQKKILQVKDTMIKTLCRNGIDYICILILALEVVAFLVLTPPANYGEWAVRLGVILNSSVALLVSVVFLIVINRKHPSLMRRNCLLCAASYVQIIYCGLTYQAGVISFLVLPLFQGAFGILVWKYAGSLRNQTALLSNLLFSSLWAISLGGHLYYYNVSNDAETVGVVTTAKIIVAIVIMFISSIVMLVRK